MLKINKSISVNGQSVIGDVIVANFNATIPSENAIGSNSVNRYIQNQELYEANRTEVRNDERAFQDAVYEVEDSMYAETVPEEPQA